MSDLAIEHSIFLRSGASLDVAKQSREFLSSSSGRAAIPNQVEFHGNALRDTDVSNSHDYTPGTTGRKNYQAVFVFFYCPLHQAPKYDRFGALWGTPLTHHMVMFFLSKKPKKCV